ncbi:hypothetical protein HYS31_05595 [Candidatus Woesearchaeota archaeon]|nr:hypothetical protein [Candidatus Woesearchaeota archaeon]
MAEFWNSLLTEKSLDLLTKISKEPFKFIVIGGWAAYLWTKLHKSKDIDIAITNLKELQYLKQKYALKKNDNLKKYEISFKEIDLDIYAAYFSKLPIPIEDLPQYTAKIEGFVVLKPEALLILKQGAELERKESPKGAKDQIDIMALLFYTDIDASLYFDLLKKYNLENYFIRLKSIINNFKDYNYLNLNPRQFKLKKKEALVKLKLKQAL